MNINKTLKDLRSNLSNNLRRYCNMPRPGSTSPAGYIHSRPSTENNVEVEVKTQTQTQIPTQLAPTLSSQLVSPATECMLRLEEKSIPLMYEWSAALLPILYSVKILDNVYYVIFNTHDLLNGKKKVDVGHLLLQWHRRWENLTF